MSIDLKSIVSKQLPEFAREDYQLFTAFIEAYYDYMDRKTFQVGATGPVYSGGNQQRNLTELRDIDKTVDEYIKFFKNELDILGGTYPNIDQRLFLRKVKELFISKGVESSYKFLFRLLYGSVSDVSYPWDQVLKASDGKWQQDTSLFVNFTEGDPTILPGNRIEVVGNNQKIKVFVDKVVPITDTVYEVSIDRYYYGTIKVGQTISYKGTVGVILPTTINYNIELPGSGYKVGQIIDGTTIANGKTVNQRLKITRVDENGGVMNIATLKFGYGYDSNFYLLKSIGPITTNSTFEISRDSQQQYSIVNDSKIDQYNDYGYVLSPDYVDLTFTDPTYVATFLQQFYEESLSGQGANPNYLLIRFDIGAVAKYQGYYKTNDGFLDDDIFIQDSYRWQKYSYVVKVNQKLSDYKSLIKSYLHPAGTALFGEYQVQNTFGAGVTCLMERGTWKSSATFSSINKDIDGGDYVFPNTTVFGKITKDAYEGENYFAAGQEYDGAVNYIFNNIEPGATGSWVVQPSSNNQIYVYNP